MNIEAILAFSCTFVTLSSIMYVSVINVKLRNENLRLKSMLDNHQSTTYNQP